MTNRQAKWFAAGVVLAIVLAMAGLVTILVFCLADVPPPDVSDLVPVYPAVSNEANAGPLIVEAAGLAYWPSNKPARDVAMDMANGGDWDAELAAAILASNRQALAVLDQALAKPLCRMPVVTDSNDPLPPYAEVRTLARVVALQAIQARRAGDVEASAGHALTIIRLGRILAEYPECLVQYLVGLAVTDLGLDQVIALAALPAAGAAPLLTLQRNVSGLAAGQEPFTRALQSEFRYGTNVLNQLWQGKFASGQYPTLERLAPRLLLQPNRTLKAIADYYRLALTHTGASAAVLTNHPFMIQDDQSRLRALASPNAVGNVVMALMLPLLDSMWVKPYQLEASFRASVLSLALNAYQRDHGLFPDTLEALVPDYLAEIPLDPFDDQPFRYVKDRAIVYSIGKDLTDSGGQESTNANAGPGAVQSPGQQRRTSPDMVFHLE